MKIKHLCSIIELYSKYNESRLKEMNDKLRNESTDRLAEALLSLKNKDEVYAIFEDLFTVAEVKALAQRLDVAIMLSEKEPYTEIVAKTGVSTATISRVNRCLLYGADGYNIILSNGITIMTKYILITTGFKMFEASKKEEYGYGIYNNVVTNSDLESWFNDNKNEGIATSAMSAVGFVHCVGSRDVKAGNAQCSKVCCITAIKQAIEMKEKYPQAQIYCFYMDLRLFGKKFEDFYIKAQKDYGIHFIRGRVSEVCENIDGKVIVKAEDTLVGKPIKVTQSDDV